MILKKEKNYSKEESLLNQLRDIQYQLDDTVKQNKFFEEPTPPITNYLYTSRGFRLVDALDSILKGVASPYLLSKYAGEQEEIMEAFKNIGEFFIKISESGEKYYQNIEKIKELKKQEKEIKEQLCIK